MAGMAARLGKVCRQAREAHGLRAIDIAIAAGVSEATISNFEGRRSGFRRETEVIVAAYERECGLAADELWRRAIGTA